MRPADRAAAQLASAAYQDLDVARSAGYARTLDTLGCFQDPALGGMGLHYLNGALMDATIDITKPEALVHKLDAGNAVTGLVAHEYIVPIEAWTAADPPTLFGVPFHRHPTPHCAYSTPGCGKTTRPVSSPTGTQPSGSVPRVYRSSGETSQLQVRQAAPADPPHHHGRPVPPTAASEQPASRSPTLAAGPTTSDAPTTNDARRCVASMSRPKPRCPTRLPACIGYGDVRPQPSPSASKYHRFHGHSIDGLHNVIGSLAHAACSRAHTSLGPRRSDRRS